MRVGGQLGRVFLASAMSSRLAAHMSTSAGAGMMAKQRWAVLGDVLNAAKPAAGVVGALKRAGKEVLLVNPRDKTGECHTSLKACAEQLDADTVVDLIINPVAGLQLIEEAAEIGIKSVFIQPGAGSDAIRDLCAKNGMVVYEGCVMVELDDHAGP